jgi:hypothetical protein
MKRLTQQREDEIRQALQELNENTIVGAIGLSDCLGMPKTVVEELLYEIEQLKKELFREQEMVIDMREAKEMYRKALEANNGIN